MRCNLSKILSSPEQAEGVNSSHWAQDVQRREMTSCVWGFADCLVWLRLRVHARES